MAEAMGPCTGWRRCVDGLKNLVRVIAFPSHATSACDSVSVQRDHLLAHVITTHVDANFTSDELLQVSSVSDSDSVTCVNLLNYFNFSFVIPYISH